MKKRIKTNTGISAFIYHQGKFLLLREAPKKNKKHIFANKKISLAGRSFSKGCWLLPGGRVEKGEFLLTALKREIWEETGLRKIKILGPLGYWEGLHDKKHRQGISFFGLYQGGKIKLSFEHDQYRWMTLQEIKQHKTSHAYSYFVLAERLIKSKIPQKFSFLIPHS